MTSKVFRFDASPLAKNEGLRALDDCGTSPQSETELFTEAHKQVVILRTPCQTSKNPKPERRLISSKTVIGSAKRGSMLSHRSAFQGLQLEKQLTLKHLTLNGPDGDRQSEGASATFALSNGNAGLLEDLMEADIDYFEDEVNRF
jgi:hypothetical protein